MKTEGKFQVFQTIDRVPAVDTDDETGLKPDTVSHIWHMSS